MKTIHAVYTGGVFRPTQTVELPENCEVEFEPRIIALTVAERVEELRKTNPGLAAIYEVLSRRHNSGHHDTAERHNEHQP
jgi:predicted DNA-binding antitoxin AbrB/MazE fold protein